MDAEFSKLIFYRLQQRIAPVSGEKFDGGVLRYGGKLGAVFTLHCFGKLLHVIAMIPIYRKFGRHPQQLLITRVQRSSQILHLFARIIDVVFALDHEADGLVQPRQHIAHDSHTPVTDMEGTGRVDTGELDLYLAASPYIEIAFLPLRKVPQSLIVKLRRKGKVQKTRAGDLLAREISVGILEILEDHLRDNPWRLFSPFRP